MSFSNAQAMILTIILTLTMAWLPLMHSIFPVIVMAIVALLAMASLL
jgi:hypothetical protein